MSRRTASITDGTESERSPSDSTLPPPAHRTPPPVRPSAEQHPPKDNQEEDCPPTPAGGTQKDPARCPAGLEFSKHYRRFGTNSNTRW